MRNTDSVIWGFSGGTNTPEVDDTHRFCDKIWSAINNRLCNLFVLTLIAIEGSVVLIQILIDLNIIQDPNWRQKPVNCSNGTVLIKYPRKMKAETVLANISITLLSIFVIEILLRIISGRSKYIVQGIEVFDTIVVLVAFGLNLSFFLATDKVQWYNRCCLNIIWFRMWRSSLLIQSIIDSSKARLAQAIIVYQKEKKQSEHKIDLLILKVEDLEHEVAYLKEKLKKAEKEPLFMKRRKAKESSSLPFPLPPDTICLPASRSLQGDHCHSPFQVRELKSKVTLFAENASALIVDEALLLASHIRSPSDLPPPHQLQACRLKRRPEGSIESGYGSDRPAPRPRIRSDEEKAPLSAVRDAALLRCPAESGSPESGYGSGCSAPAHPPPGKAVARSASVFLFPEAGEAIALDERTEIERVRRVEFNPVEKDVPMTSL